MKNFKLNSISAVIVSAMSLGALAQSTLPTIVVTSEREGTLTVPSAVQARRDIERTPGAVSIVEDAEYKNGAAQTLKDVLDYVPGVYVQSRYGEDARVSIRGSGLSRPYGNRGINMFMDGIPINTSDGLVDLFEIDPTAYRYVEVFKGANAMRYGSNALGGAINFVTPTGRDAAGFASRFDAGTSGYQRIQFNNGGVNNEHDYYLTISEQGNSGYREHSNGKSIHASGNYGYQFSSTAETRFYLNVNQIDQRMPGELSKSDALNSPKKANSDFTWKDQARNIDSYRLANKTTLRFDQTTIDFGVFKTHRHVDHPNFMYLDYTVDDEGVFGRLTDERKIAGYRNVLVTGVNVLNGKIDSTTYSYTNTYTWSASPIAGTVAGAAKGSLASSTFDTSKNSSIYFDDSVYVREDVAVSFGTKLQKVVRGRNDRVGNTNNSFDFNNTTPKLGVLWDVDASSQIYANASRSAEIPTYDTLTFTSSTPDLKAQTATTFEVGSRGRRKAYVWDVSIYQSKINNELQCLALTYGATGTCTQSNADKTVHQGLEAGGGVEVSNSVFNKGDSLWVNAAYTYNNFHFDADPTFGNNKLAGVPTQYLRAELLLKDPSGYYAGPNVEWMPKSYYADNSNTTSVDPYSLLNFKLGFGNIGYGKNAGWSGYVEGRNLLDKRYIATVDVAKSATAADAIFHPGFGRSVRAGLQYKW